MSNFHLKVTTSSGVFYDGECESLVIPTEDGEYGILANHESVVIGVIVGQMRYKIDSEWKYVVTGQGFARSLNNEIILVLDSAERPEDVDINRAIEAKKRAEERMALKKSRQEYYRGRLAMTRAMERIKIKEKKFM